MRTPSWWLLILVAAGCKNDPVRPDARLDGPQEPDAFIPSWWTPKPGDAANWDIQLVAPFDVSAARTMYDLDLWKVTPAKTITYADSSMVNVPPGELAGMIDALHARTPRTYVICHFNALSVNVATDPDRMQFPGYAPNPPNMPNPPTAGSVIGWSTGFTDTNERWLDIREAGRAKWAEMLEKRIQLGKDIGCDGFDVDDLLVSITDFGFGDPDGRDVAAIAKQIAGLAHTRALAVGGRFANFGLPDQLVHDYDWMYLERCSQQVGECMTARPFLQADKAVLAIDYSPGSNITLACAEWDTAAIKDGIMKNDPPTKAYREVCP